MFQYLIKRVVLAIFTLLIIMAASYTLLRMAPGDPTRSHMLGGETPGAGLSAEKGEFAENISLRRRLHLDKPIHVGFLHWLEGVVWRGDFGTSASIDPGRPVTAMIMERLPVTLTINLLAIMATYLLAIPLGIFTALKPNGRLDRGITFLLFLLYSLPVIWVALLLQAGFCEGGRWPLFPLKGVVPANTWDLTSWRLLAATARHYVLPVVCLSYGGFAVISRFARSGMLDVINQDYIYAARAKGAPEYLVIFKHALRNGMLPLITLFAGLIPGLIAGSIIVEHIFNINGMGSLALLSLSSRDYPLQMALFCISGVLSLIGILVSDLLYVLVDPRINFDQR